MKRVSEKSREGKGKILDPDQMKELLYKSYITSKIAFVEANMPIGTLTQNMGIM